LDVQTQSVCFPNDVDKVLNPLSTHEGWASGRKGFFETTSTHVKNAKTTYPHFAQLLEFVLDIVPVNISVQ
jgi:hypothetical protein